MSPEECPSCGSALLFGALLCDHCGETTNPIKGELYLTLLSERGSYLVNKAVITKIGREPIVEDGCECIKLSNEDAEEYGISRQHAILFGKDSKFFIKDTQSTNGTWVNLNKIENGNAHEIIDGDEIKLGRLIFRVRIDHR